MIAGSSSPSGFEPVTNPNGGGVPLMDMAILSGNGTAMAVGDALTRASGTVSRAAAGDVICGVFQGCKYQDSAGTWQWAPYIAASTAGIAFVAGADNVEQQYRVQGGSTTQSGSSVSQATDEGLNANHVDAAPSTTLLKSQQYLGTITTTSTLGWHVVRIERSEDNPIGTAYPIYVVKCARHALANQVVGA
jgi:hypothetical protein